MNFKIKILDFIRNYSLSCSLSENVTVCCMFLTVPVTVVKAERYFLKLKIIKKFSWSTMSQEKLSYLVIISIEKCKSQKGWYFKFSESICKCKYSKEKFIIIIQIMWLCKMM